MANPVRFRAAHGAGGEFSRFGSRAARTNPRERGVLIGGAPRLGPRSRYSQGFGLGCPQVHLTAGRYQMGILGRFESCPLLNTEGRANRGQARWISPAATSTQLHPLGLGGPNPRGIRASV